MHKELSIYLLSDRGGSWLMFYNAIVVIPLVGYAAKRFHLAVVPYTLASAQELWSERKVIACLLCTCVSSFALPGVGHFRHFSLDVLA